MTVYMRKEESGDIRDRVRVSRGPGNIHDCAHVSRGPGTVLDCVHEEKAWEHP